MNSNERNRDKMWQDTFSEGAGQRPLTEKGYLDAWRKADAWPERGLAPIMNQHQLDGCGAYGGPAPVTDLVYGTAIPAACSRPSSGGHRVCTSPPDCDGCLGYCHSLAELNQRRRLAAGVAYGASDKHQQVFRNGPRVFGPTVLGHNANRPSGCYL